MKIGLVVTAYNCEKYIKDCLKPWLNLRNKFNIIISANSGMFKPYKDFGFEEKNNETLKVLIESKLDFLVTTSGDNLLDEDSSRNLCLDYLNKHNVDLVWIVDGDEIYTENQIINIINLIEQDKNHSSYFIQFKNYTIKYPYFTKGFSRETIYKTNVCDGISHFHFDVYITYNNGKTNHDLNNGLYIPKEIAYVDHFSWLDDDSRSFEKITYQENRFIGPEGKRCAFKSDSGKLLINEDFFENRGMDVPNLHKSNHLYSFDFDLYYSKKNKVFYLDWFTRDINLKIKLFNINDREKLIVHNMSVNAGMKYYITPPSWFFGNDFKGFIVEVWENDSIIHSEDIIV